MDFSLGSLKSGPGLIFIAGSDKLDTPRNATWISHMMVSKRYILLYKYGYFGYLCSKNPGV